ncbi:metallophosphoesterase [Streptomyces sp. HPF1205]|uniref:metallophosphoesterase family protein n=1 Tax=Streptomyces sp. HPF1205 TaxID=2873262 RepID=UPI001CEDB989|nr:metallophosphoesterase [Streptomyces sp. HPF1205]
MRRRTLAALTAATGALLLTATAATAQGDHNPWPYQGGPGRTAVLAAVGDIACEPDGDDAGVAAKYLCDSTRSGAQAMTADQIEAMRPDLVALLGDEQYQVGRYNDFMGSFDTTYGAFKYLQRPAPGNHEFYDYKDGEKGVDGSGYYSYYNGRTLDSAGSPLTDAQGQPVPRPHGQAGTAGQGWYSYDLGAWHIISLNAECKVQNGGCSADGAWVKQQTDWLKDDLAGDHAPCTLAYWHQPAFSASASSSDEGEMSQTQWWPLLYGAGVDVVLNGHEHLYARFAPQDPQGQADPRKGIREFVIGTGGEGLDTLAPADQAPNRVAGDDASYGVSRFTLAPTGYSWSYQAANGTGYTDSGSARCHGPAHR